MSRRVAGFTNLCLFTIGFNRTSLLIFLNLAKLRLLLDCAAFPWFLIGKIIWTTGYLFLWTKFLKVNSTEAIWGHTNSVWQLMEWWLHSESQLLRWIHKGLSKSCVNLLWKLELAVECQFHLVIPISVSKFVFFFLHCKDKNTEKSFLFSENCVKTSICESKKSAFQEENEGRVFLPNQ